jgi:hypothetical protein
MGPTQWWFWEGARGGCCNYLRCAVLLDCETLFVTESLGSSIHSFHGAWIFWTSPLLQASPCCQWSSTDEPQATSMRLHTNSDELTNNILNTLQHYYPPHHHRYHLHHIHDLFELYIGTRGLQLFPGQWHRHFALDKLISLTSWNIHNLITWESANVLWYWY